MVYFVGPISIVDLANVAVLEKPPLLVGLYYERPTVPPGNRASSNLSEFEVLLVSSERIVTPSRHG